MGLEIDKEYLELKRQYQEASGQLSETLEKLARDFKQDLRHVGYLFEMGGYKTVPLSNGCWSSVAKGIRIQLIDDTKLDASFCTPGTPIADQHCSRVLMEGKGAVPMHTHQFDERILVIQGKALSTTQGVTTELSAGQDIYHCKNIPHQVYIDGLFMVWWNPPLKKFSDPLDVAFSQCTDIPNVDESIENP